MVRWGQPIQDTRTGHNQVDLVCASTAEGHVEDEIAEVVREHGWYAADIYDAQPRFLYTIGLMQTFDHPELIMFGLEADNTYALFAQLVRDLRAGRSYAEPGVSTVTIGGDEHRVGFRRVHPTQHELFLGFAMGYCRYAGLGELEAVQAFWPDAAGRFPFEVGCDAEVDRLQPRLDLGLTPRELRQWRRRWE